MVLLKAKEIYLEEKVLFNSAIAVENGCITAVDIQQEQSFCGDIIDLGSLKLLPGFIDIHVHGGNGYDIMDSTYEAVNGISEYKILEGVTAFCPTTVTCDTEGLKNALECIKQSKDRGVNGARIIWPFIEGPFINILRKGAHRAEHVNEKPDGSIYDLIESYGGKLSLLMAPELNGALDIIHGLTGKGMNVRIGHSNADFETAVEAVENGSNIAVHLFNAMEPVSARSPGIISAALLNNGIYAEIICDLVHVHRACLELLLKVKDKDKIILITDCMRAGGMSDGEYSLGEEAVTVKNGVARTLNGNLAGSTLKMIDALKNLNDNFSVEFCDIIKMASLNPARALGIDRECGSIAYSKRADLIAVDDNLNVKFVMVDGIVKKSINML